MNFLMRLVALAVGVLGTYVLPNEYALVLLGLAIVVAVGPIRLLKLLFGLFILMRAFAG